MKDLALWFISIEQNTYKNFQAYNGMEVST